jgi:hypothetical protein
MNKFKGFEWLVEDNIRQGQSLLRDFAELLAKHDPKGGYWLSRDTYAYEAKAAARYFQTSARTGYGDPKLDFQFRKYQKFLTMVTEVFNEQAED